jgi:hypothetical protein
MLAYLAGETQLVSVHPFNLPSPYAATQHYQHRYIVTRLACSSAAFFQHGDKASKFALQLSLHASNSVFAISIQG